MKSKYGMLARLVWDGGYVAVPEELGTAAPNQMLGTQAERLSELSGRACYDSLGRGRSSAEYHDHILEVRHGSVYEHWNTTIDLTFDVDYAVFFNRPGVWVRPHGKHLAVTLSPRCILDWDYWSTQNGSGDFRNMYMSVGDILSFAMEQAAPAIVKPALNRALVSGYEKVYNTADPSHPEEKWVSMFLSGSRGFSHEMVRHKFRTAVSQRSTRYVNEDESPWFAHPLYQEWREDKSVDVSVRGDITSLEEATIIRGQDMYERLNGELYKWLVGRGIDKGTARKQARGAARGYLGNALATEMIFSGSVGQWKRMLRMRCSAPADGEIRAVFVEALGELKKSRYAADFEAFSLEASPDGIGQCMVEKT